MRRECWKQSDNASGPDTAPRGTESKVTVKDQRGGRQAARCKKIVLVTTIINK